MKKLSAVNPMPASAFWAWTGTAAPRLTALTGDPWAGRD
jgi:hypothetical protein